jgi:predicted DNA-binding transcriptional regulator AlpA
MTTTGNTSNESHRLIRQRELKKLLNISQSTLWRWRRKNLIPKPFLLGERTIVWELREINEWLNTMSNQGVLK